LGSQAATGCKEQRLRVTLTSLFVFLYFYKNADMGKIKKARRYGKICKNFKNAEIWGKIHFLSRTYGKISRRYEVSPAEPAITIQWQKTFLKKGDNHLYKSFSIINKNKMQNHVPAK
jgi:hypothetical protein